MIVGSGGGSGSSSSQQRIPVEASDTLRSKQFARLVDVISEGEIEGIVGDLKGVYLDNTPIQNQDDSYNFSGIVLDSRNGTQNQSYMSGFPSVEVEKNVGVEVVYNTPIVRTISSPDVNLVKITVSIPALSSTSATTGDTTGTSVQLGIDVQSNGGGYVPYNIGFRNDKLQFLTSGNVTTTYPTTNETVCYLQWVSPSTSGTFNASYTLEARLYGDSVWNVIYSGKFSGKSTVKEEGVVSGEYYDLITTITPAKATKAIKSGLFGRCEYRLSYSGQGEVKVYNIDELVGIPIDTISGKASSKYQKDYWVVLSGDAPWDIKLRRITKDSTTARLLNKTWWESYSEVIESKLSYPNSALVGLTVDASLFSSVPQRSFLARGIRVKVPTNYDTESRVYSGFWDGTFKVAWTDNPVWVFYDLVTNNRYGLGSLINQDVIDVGSLYSISRYCDEMVPDGYGGVEPRYTCNLYLQSREEAYNVIGNIASIFNSMVFWGSGSISISADMPSDVVWMFTNANVIDGDFTYSGSALSARHTVALVAWNDPQDLYKQKTEYVESSHEDIAEFGVRETQVVAIGCTSRGQAHRLGKRILLTEKMLTETVTFSTGLEGIKCYPGAVIGIQDNFRSGKRIGGRVSEATSTDITLDSSVTLDAGVPYVLSVILPDGSVESKAVSNASGTHTTLTVVSGFSAAPIRNSIWVLSSSTTSTQLFKVISVKETGDLKWEVTALQYNPSKFDAIDFDTNFKPLVYSEATSKVDPVTNVTISEELFLTSSSRVENRMVVSWSPSQTKYLDGYVVSWRYENENWKTLPSTKVNTVDVDGVLPGKVEVSIRSISAIGVSSVSTYGYATLLGKTAPPSDVSNFLVKTVNQTMYLSWSPVTDLDISHYVIRFSPNTTGVTWESSSLLIPKIASPTTNAVVPSMTGTYLIKAVDDSGNESINAISLVSSVADINSYNVLESLVEHPSFSGTKTNTLVSSGILQLNNSLLGYYNFQNDVDLGGVFTSRVLSSLSAFGTNLAGTMDTWEPLSVAVPLSGVSGKTWSAIVQVRTTNDNPSGSPVWSSWEELTIGEYTCRAFQFRAKLESYVENVTPSVQELTVTVDMPDRVDGGEDVVCGTSGYTVTYAKAFKNSPAVSISAQGLTTGDYYVITSKSSTGFTIRFYNSSNVAVQRTFDWVAKGYGYVTV